jgi:hypothetical protein
MNYFQDYKKLKKAKESPLSYLWCWNDSRESLDEVRKSCSLLIKEIENGMVHYRYINTDNANYTHTRSLDDFFINAFPIKVL